MEHWNESESKEEILKEKFYKKILDWICECDDMSPEEREERIKSERESRKLKLKSKIDDKGKTYSLEDIFAEDTKDRMPYVEGEESSDTAFMEPDDKSERRKKLNRMFEALFDCRYKDVLIRNGKSYIMGEAGKVFLKFLLKIHSTPLGKAIRDKQYDNIEFEYENYLLYLAVMFLDEQEELEGEKKKTYEELRKVVMEKFSVDDETMELKKSLVLFNQEVKDISKEEDLKWMHELMAIIIDNTAKIITDDLPYLV